MSEIQQSILPGVPAVARYLSFSVASDAKPVEILQSIELLDIDEWLTVGIGEPFVKLLGTEIVGLRTFPALKGPETSVPSTQQWLWCWIRAENENDLNLRSDAITQLFSGLLKLENSVDGFKHGQEELGKDLTGYEDGTENPTGEEAIAAAFDLSDVAGMRGSSFVAVQQWVHDLQKFTAFPQPEQDNIIGRRKSDNAELESAPHSAHVKRTEQESFQPAAFIVRRSMPFRGAEGEGLMFVAFGKSLNAFETQLRRMVGLEDGTTDALFRFSQPVTGGYFWCPPLVNGKLDLSALKE
ncbi:putative iron-dependent peroxidase [Alteromonadaceae bacterium Bs31]|nr:putative iron-dependent peroxidase [Alteromonadaceae bacterium Bs31]